MMITNEKSSLGFEGNVVLITGAAKGIGKTTALAFSEQGATVVLVDVLEKELKEVHGIIQKAGREVLSVTGDVSNNSQVQDAVKKTVKGFGKIDVLVNNAGIDVGSAPIINVTEKMWDKSLQVNLKSVFYFCKGVVPIMLENGKGSIVNVASIAGREPNENMAPYAISKAGVICFSRVLAKEVAKDGIRVNCVAPGLTKTDLLKNLAPEQFDRLLKKIPMGRVGYPEEVADLILFLSSEKSSFITGQCFNIAGGRGEY
jgi:NAD(P)-dependent dehydrogenase (short-subunit alcohol dehydrogenase family)